MHEALLWSREGERVRCLLCPHACSIAEGSRGVCGVREHRDGVLWALTYGKVSSVAVDPIEKKPVFHFHPGTSALSLGSVGCTMRCLHCQNWSISHATPGEAGRAGDLEDLPVDEVVSIARRTGCQGVAFTYNEPVIWAEYVLDVSRRCKEAGLYTVMVTNGYVTEAGLDLLGEVIDVWRVDVKGADDATYRKLCKAPSSKPVFEMAERAKSVWGMHVEVVTNVVPTINDDETTLRSIASWVHDRLGPGTPWHVTRFFPYLELSHLEPTPLATLRRAREIGREEGLDFVYLGNIAEPGGEDTVCPGCGAIALRRDGYSVMEADVTGGACSRCGRGLGIEG